MIYRKIPKNGDEVSLLGYGCMRFPTKNGRPDEKRTEKQVLNAIEKGVNFFDTAYTYPGSEGLLGKILKKSNKRKKVKIATKLPHQSIKKSEDIEKIFKKQLERLETDYIDYYLIHNICTFEEWESLKENGIIDFVKKAKKDGRIINFGFSFHGNIVTFKKVVDDYDWDCCLIQYNYLDDKYQAGSEGVDYASKKGLGILIMEPLKGGLLVDKLPNEAKDIINNFKVKKTPAEWSFSWICDNPNVHVVLSGMNDEKIIEENINLFSNIKSNSLTNEEKDMLNEVKEEIQKSMAVSCTSCGYCMPCPEKIDIPFIFSIYNDKQMFGGFRPTMAYLVYSIQHPPASNCSGCKACERKCPQNLAIIEELGNVNKTMDNFFFKMIAKVVMKVMFR